MKYYRYEGKIYRSHNRATLARRLFPRKVNNWGEFKIPQLTKKINSIKVLKGKEKEQYEIQKKASYRRRCAGYE
jgi:hypothetical protein